ncbi:MAG: NnrU family protein [Rubellimicrobium sp.]|nr:NnrU family protein [Rubellimicrobium sp.]
MGGWFEYVAAWAVFLLSHMIPARPGLRGRLVGMLGRRGYTIAYSILSVVIFLWLVRAAGRAPFVGLWPRPDWGPWFVLAMMTLALGILTFGLGRPNPFSFGGSGGAFDPARAGVLRFVHHPVLATAFLWALAHMVVNGDLAHVILFGGFVGFAIFGKLALDARNRRRMGEAAWAEAVAATRAAPLRPAWGTLVRALVTLALVLVLVALHPWLAGIDIEPLFRP